MNIKFENILSVAEEVKMREAITALCRKKKLVLGKIV